MKEEKKAIRFLLEDDLHRKFTSYVTNHCCDYSKILRKLIKDLVDNELNTNFLHKMMEKR